MGIRRKGFSIAAITGTLVLALVLAACSSGGGGDAAPTNTPAIQPTSPPAATSVPQPTAAPEPTVGPTPVPVPEATTAPPAQPTVAPTRAPAPATPAPTAAPTTPTGPTTPATPPKLLRVGLLSDISTTNPCAVLGPDPLVSNFYALTNRYATLYTLSDFNLSWVPSLADGNPTALAEEDGLFTMEVNLKQGVLWSDGEEITAEDVVFTLTSAQELQLSGGWAAIVDPNVFDHAEATNTHTVKFFFKSPPGLGSWQFGLSQSLVLAQHFWQPIVDQARQAGTQEAQQVALFGHVPDNEPTAGEMMLTRRQAGEFIELVKNPNYYWAGSTVEEYANGAYVEEKPGVFEFSAYGDPEGAPAVTLTRGPHVDGVLFKIYEQQLPAIIDLRSDVIDFILSPQGIDPSLRKHLTGREIGTIENAANQVRALVFNLNKPGLDSREFRQAVATLVDREFIANIVLQKIAKASYTFVPEENRFWWNSDVPLIGRDLPREQRITDAVTLLKAAGFTWDQEPRFDQAVGVVPGQGIRLPSGELLPEITLMAPVASFDPLRASVAVWIERWLNEAGIPVTVQLGDSNEIVGKVFSQRDFEMAFLVFNLAEYPSYLLSIFHSQGPGNAGSYSNPDYDAKAEQFFFDTDVNTAQTNARELQTFIAEDLPVLPLFNVPVLEAYRDDVVQWAFTNALNGLQGYFQGINGALSYTRLKE